MLLNGENTTSHCELFMQLDNQIDHFEQWYDNDGTLHVITLLVQ